MHHEVAGEHRQRPAPLTATGRRRPRHPVSGPTGRGQAATRRAVLRRDHSKQTRRLSTTSDFIFCDAKACRAGRFPTPWRAGGRAAGGPPSRYSQPPWVRRINSSCAPARETRLPPVAWVLAGLVTLFSLVTSLTQVSGPMVQAAKPETAHYASMTDLLNLFGAL